MGRKKKGFNWKARQNLKTEIDDSATSKIKIDLADIKEKYDDCNKLVIPSKKRPTKQEKNKVGTSRILSKAQRKKLEKIVEKKKKKADRSSLLEALAKVQALPEEISQLTSIASVQTKGLKRHFMEQENNPVNALKNIDIGQKDLTVDSISVSKKRRRLLAALLNKNQPQSVVSDPNIVGFDSLTNLDEDSEGEDSVKETQGEQKGVQEETVEEPMLESETQEVRENNIISESVNEKTEDKTNKPKQAIVLSQTKSTPAVFVPVFRTPEMEEARLKLPITAEEQSIMEKINENRVVILAGETGSGKTTQVPQFLYEAGYTKGGKMIGITQPRRVAAISMSKRVAEEMNLGFDVVSYLIRFEGNVTPKTQIKYMTDGVLLKEIQSDFILSKYSVIILDEAHERSIHTDILIGLLSRIVPLRYKRQNPLKLIIMSATLRIEDFTENSRLFKIPPPVIKVESRQFPVSVHFNKRTADDYLKECYNKTCKIHTQLPEGGILVFVTGQQEVNTLVRKLRKAFPLSRHSNDDSDVENDLQQSLEIIKRSRRKGSTIRLPNIDLDKYSVVPTDDTEGDLLADDELNNSDEDENAMKACNQPMWILPLYSLLPSSKQAKVFEKPPPGCRLCVVSTNVAETSLTIPHIKYVVDSGRTKTRLYDKVTGVSAFHVTWCSKASANQRAGRAGRVGPGHCYRLYSSAVFNDEFELFAVPEIQQKPVDDLILQMKSMNIVKVVNFPFPTSPDALQLRSAEKRLKILGALSDDSNQDEWSSKLTKLGETMASFPVSPRYAKMLALSCQHDLLQYTICIVAALSVQEVLMDKQGGQNLLQMRRCWAGTGNAFLLGDAMVLLRAVGAAESSKSNLEEFCEKYGLRHKAMVEIRKLRVQLTNQINLNIPSLDLAVDPDMKPPTDVQAKLLRQIVLSGMCDQVAHKVNLEEMKEDEEKRKWKRAYRGCEMEEPIFLHSQSVLRKEMPEWIVYQEVYETNKLYMRGVTAIEPEWLPIFVPSLCNMSEPMSDPAPRYDPESGKVFCHVSGTFGRAAMPLPVMEIAYTSTLDSFKWFAKFLLNGNVFPKLKKYKTSLLSAPSAITKSWAKLQPRTEILLKTLASAEVNTKDQLENAWKEDPHYLLDAYKSWLPESAHADLMSTWPPV